MSKGCHQREVFTLKLLKEIMQEEHTSAAAFEEMKKANMHNLKDIFYKYFK